MFTRINMLIAGVMLLSGFAQYATERFGIDDERSRLIPRILNYQGYLTDTVCIPVDDSLDMTFKIFDAASGGNELWSETQTKVPVERGVFSVLLGETTQIPDSVFESADRWLELTLEGPQTLTPRTRITSVGYAYMSTYSDTADYANNAAPDNDWTVTDSVLYTGNYWGLARGSASNQLHGNNIRTHVNFGVVCTTGVSAEDISYCTVSGGYHNTATNDNTTVSGGWSNTASGYGASISGGRDNTSSSSHATVGGGRNNTASSNYTTISGGVSNTVSSVNATVGGGMKNRISGNAGTIAGGYENSVEGDYSAICGGYADSITATADYSYLFGIGSKLTQDSTFMVDMPHIKFGDETNGYEFPAQDGSVDQIMITDGSGQVSWSDFPSDTDWARGTPDSVLFTAHYLGIARGGAGNTLYGDSAHTHTNLGIQSTTGAPGLHYYYCTIAGGYNNIAGKYHATVGGGRYNVASGAAATIAGGGNNSASNDYSTIGGGQLNTASNSYATVSGGVNNTVSSWDATVGGGRENTISGNAGTIAGGYENSVTGDYAAICGGIEDTVGAKYCGILGGYNNNAGETTVDSAATVCGGYNNAACSTYAAVVGGINNTARGLASIVAAGNSNLANGNVSFIGGGTSNTASGYRSVVGGGSYNVASSTNATVSGGSDNTASDAGATVGGGYGNTASDANATVSGGYSNIASGYHSTVSGGYNNATAGDYTTIPGGISNSISVTGDYSMAFGHGVYVNTQFRVAFFESSFPGRLALNRDYNDGGILYPIHVGTNTGNGNGAHLTGGGTWTNGSSRSFKEDFRVLKGTDVLDRINNMSIMSWSFKGTDEQHIGPVAEDFYSAFKCGTGNPAEDSLYLAAGDVAGVALVAIQELTRQVKLLQEENAALQQRVKTLEKNSKIQ
jgi:hypothetical protein